MRPISRSCTLFVFVLCGSVGLAAEVASQPAGPQPTTTRSASDSTSTRPASSDDVFGFDLERIAVEGVDWQWPAKAVPLISVRHGPTRDGSTQTKIATGVIAIGDVAVGVVALGGVTVGVLSIGGVSIGVVGVGGVAFAWLFALGGVAVGKRFVLGPVAIGRFAIGAVAIGRTAFGIVAIGARGFGVIPLTGTVARMFRGGR